MSDFEFVFVLYSLLLGLSMVELLGGLGRALEVRFAAQAERETFSIGWLTPLLAIFVMLDLLSFWSAAWVARTSIAVSTTTLMAVAAFASVYFLAARLVFPSHPEGFGNLDVHYFRVRRIVLGLLLVLLVAQLGYYLSLPDLAARTTPRIRIKSGRTPLENRSQSAQRAGSSSLEGARGAQSFDGPARSVTAGSFKG